MKSYGDRLDDGRIQLSFTLPIESGPLAKEAARDYAERLGLEQIHVAWMEGMGSGFTCFVVYGTSQVSVDPSRLKIVVPDIPDLTPHDIIAKVQHDVGRPLVIVGACIGADAHTVGIDAILSLKGFSGDKGLESYACFKVHNLRSQVESALFVKEAIRLKADAILVSRLVTQQDEHIRELEGLVRLLKETKGLQVPLISCIGGPRIDQRLAKKLGFDGGFGVGTKPREVASFIVHSFIKQLERRRSDGDKGTSRDEGLPAPKARRGRRPVFWRFGGRGDDS